jgi:poly-gamma-glutamate synthesis protein (capsule biosynthesis protein)
MKESTSLIFTGDIGFDKYMEGKWADESLLSSDITDFLKGADHVIANVEGPLYEVKKEETDDPKAKLVHAMDPRAVSFLKRINADIWNICNNHIMDAGLEGIKETLLHAKEANTLTLGAGMNEKEAKTPIILNEAGGIGILSVGYQRACRKAGLDTPGCFSWSDMESIQSVINEIKKTCKWCVVVSHGGEEFTSLPNRYTRDRYLEYLKMGADVVVSHHPHVPMNYETVGDKIIFYSLGNFIFDTDYQRSQYNTEFGILLKLNFTEKSVSFDAKGLKIDRETETVKAHSLPDIFTDVQKEEYEKLEPLSAKMFIEATKRQLKYMNPAKFENATEEDFRENFYEELRSGRVPGEVLDFQIVYPISLKEKDGKWKESKLEKVKDYILKQM